MIKWNELPLDIQELMLEEQEKQGNKKNASVFENYIDGCRKDGAFDWDKSKEGYFFWDKILTKGNINHFYTLHPKKPETKYPKVMWVSDREDFSDKNKRVVFMEKKGIFIAWSNAETLEESEEEYDVCFWNYAKDIEEEQKPQQLMTFEQAQTATLNWANERDLLKPENAKAQFMKFIEETGELARAILRDDREEEEDAFGDKLITIIILAEQRNIDLVKCLNKAFHVIKDRKGKTVNGNFVKEEG